MRLCQATPDRSPSSRWRQPVNPRRLIRVIGEDRSMARSSGCGNLRGVPRRGCGRSRRSRPAGRENGSRPGRRSAPCAALQPVARDLEHFERHLAHGAAAQRRRQASRGTSRSSASRSSAVQSATRSGRVERRLSSRSPTHSAGSAQMRRHGPPSAPRISRKVFRRTSGKAVVRWSVQSPRRGIAPGNAGSLPAMKSRNDWPARIDVAAVAIDEIHRHVEHVLDIALEPEARLEHERQHAAAVGIDVGPDVAAIAESPDGLPSTNGELAKSATATGCSARLDAELLHHVGFVDEVEIDLHRAGAQHHVEAELALLRHVVGASPDSGPWA